jgi:type II secretory pathway pseudopilin PulG
MRKAGLLGVLLAGVLLGACANPAREQAAARMQATRAAGAAEKAAFLGDLQRGTVPADYRAQVDAALARQLRDPDSRRVLSLRNPYGGLFCGEVNARNGFGGMTGATAFYGWFSPEGQLTRLVVGGGGEFAGFPATHALFECARTEQQG